MSVEDNENERSGPLFSNIRIFPIRANGTGTMKAGGRITVAGVMEISFKVMEGSQGTFVGWPGRYSEKVGPDGKKQWFSDVRLVDDTVKAQLDKQILAEYKAVASGKKAPATSMAARRQAAYQEPGADGIPF